MKLEKIQKEYSQYEYKIKEKHEHSNLQKAQITYAQNLMNLSLAQYQDKFCRKYTQDDHQAMIFQQEEICKKSQNSIVEYNYLLVLSNYAQEILKS